MSTDVLTTEREPQSAGPNVAPERLAHSVVFLLALTFVQRGVGFVRDMAFCRWLDKAELGQFDMAYSFLLMAAPLAVLGLPGSFGRYVEYYRSRGQLRVFLLRTSAAVALFGTLAVAAVAIEPRWFSGLIFGERNDVALIELVAMALVTVVIFNTLVSLYTALRLYRVASYMQFAMSVTFAILGTVLVLAWRADAASLVLALVGAYALASFLSLRWLREVWRSLPQPAELASPSRFWARLMPFAVWVWATNLLTNLFDMVDRYLIVHAAGIDATAALAMVGEYRASRIVPWLFVGVAELLSATITPHLAADWEAGHRQAVVSRLNFIVKSLLLGLFFASAAVELMSPLLFGVAFAGKFPLGQAVLPWTLVYCAWHAVAVVALNYLWCAEKARLATISLSMGLAVNVGLNLVLLPRYGLQGAVWATAAGNMANLVLLYAITRRLGMAWDRGACVLAVALMSIAFGWRGIAAGTLGVALAAASGWIFASDERRQIASIAQHFGEWFALQRTKMRRRGSAAGEP